MKMVKTKRLLAGFVLAVLMFALPDAPGAKAVPTVGGTASASAPCHALWYRVASAMINVTYWETLASLTLNQGNETVRDQLAMARDELSAAWNDYVWHCGP